MTSLYINPFGNAISKNHMEIRIILLGNSVMLTIIVRIIKIEISSKFNEFTGFMPEGANGDGSRR